MIEVDIRDYLSAWIYAVKFLSTLKTGYVISNTRSIALKLPLFKRNVSKYKEVSEKVCINNLQY